MPRTGKQARTMVKELNKPLDVVLAAAGKPDGNERTVVDPDAVRAALESAPNNGTKERSLLRIPRRRGRTQEDDDNLAWCQEVIDTDQALRSGQSFRPRYEKYKRTMVQYPDPLQKFLEPGERNSFEEDAGKRIPVNYIRIGLEELDLYLSSASRNFRWRSNELLAKFERKLSRLWLANDQCRFCHEELSGGFRAEVKLLLAGKKFLPDPSGKARRNALRFPDSHAWCLDIREHLRDRMVELQDAAEDINLRAELYVEIIDAIFRKYEDDGIDYSTIVSAFRGNLRVIEGKRKGA